MLYEYECECGRKFTINKLSTEYQQQEPCSCGKMADRLWGGVQVLNYEYKYHTSKAGSKWDREIKA